jgi:acetyltransferase-like isoleucine patch superfamily enzyme
MSNNVTKTTVLGKSEISIARFTYGYENISVMQCNEGAALKIGAFCSIAQNITVFLGGNHRTDWITTFPFGHIYQAELGGENIKGHPSTKGDVMIGNDVWIGRGVTIMSGISIGDGAVLSANANIVKNVMPYEIIGGNPGKVLKKRFDSDVIDLLLKLKWWDLPIDIIKDIQIYLCAQPNKESLEVLVSKYSITTDVKLPPIKP